MVVNIEFLIIPIITTVTINIKLVTPISTDFYVFFTQDLTSITITNNKTPNYTAIVSDILNSNFVKVDATYFYLFYSKNPPILPITSPITKVLLKATPNKTPNTKLKYN